MKKLIFVAMLAIAASIYQPVKAQVSINVNIGARSQYPPSYFNHVGYYAPVRYVYPQRTVVVHRSVVPTRTYYNNYSTPVNRYYAKSYAKHGKSYYKGRSRGRH